MVIDILRKKEKALPFSLKSSAPHPKMKRELKRVVKKLGKSGRGANT